MSYTMISAIFHILGILLSKNIGLYNVALFSICGIVIALARKRANLMLALAFFMFMTGGLSYHRASHNSVYTSFPDKYVTITGTIISQPMLSDGEYKYKYILEPLEVSYLDKTEKADKLLHVRSKEPYQYGDIVKFSGFLSEIATGDNQYSFDYSFPAKSKGIYNQVTAFEISKVGTISTHNPKYWLGRLKNSVFNTINTRYQGDTAALYTAILLGDKSHLSYDFTTRLIKTGVWQSIYSPYIHITLFTLIAGLFWIGSKRSRALLILLIIYALFNLGNPNILKASGLMIFIIAYRAIFGYSNKMQQLSALVLAMTLINPMLCYSRGFVLSVTSTVLLFVFYPAAFNLISRLLFRGNLKWKKLISVISVAVTLPITTFPMACYLFGGMAIYSTIITTFLIPVILLILLASTVYMPMLFIAGSCNFLENIITRLLAFVQNLPEYIKKIPFHYISSRTPTVLEIITAYLILWLVAQLISHRKRDDIFKAVSVTALSFMLAITISSQNAGLEVYFVNVGQGDSSVLHTSNETILIDGGGAAEYSGSDYNVGDRVLVPYLISHGLADIDYAIVTHFHKDHAEGIVSAVKNLYVKNIVMPDSDTTNPYRLELEKLAKDKNINIIYAKKDGMIALKSGLRLNFLAPDSIQNQSSDPNDTSIVIEAKYHNFVGLFTSDSTDTVDDSYPEYIDLLKVAHHGSDSASSRNDINQLCPKYAVISVGEDNPYALPDETVLENLENVGAQILRTDILGDIRFKIRKNGEITYKSLRKE